jgi:hypothetical protein
MLHIRFEGRSFDLAENTLGITRHSTDTAVKERLGQHLDIAQERLNDYVIDRRLRVKSELRIENEEIPILNSQFFILNSICDRRALIERAYTLPC